MGGKFLKIWNRPMSLAQNQAKRLDVSSANVRKTFIDYFCNNHGHSFVPSSPVMPFGDPSLAFVNAGMNQFKNVFLGKDIAPSSRVANSQKCIRVGGKHNDLSQVGTDGTHHTFFEMLGNWSFSDYFKKEACLMSWDLLTNVFKIPPTRLYVTYFGGDKSLDIDPDLETQSIWKEIGVADNRILPFGVKENFWEMGYTGPCGPCTEIHYDNVPDRTDAGRLVNMDQSGIIELWNLVFIQYNRKSDGSLEKLYTRHVDTGMGFERLVSVLQGKTCNYDTDLFLPLFDVIQKYSNHSGYRGTYDGVDNAYRILADHARMVTVSLTDGFLPDQNAKVREILRRGFNISENVFASKKGLMKELSNLVAEILAPAYPEIGRNLHKVQHILRYEEEYYSALKKSSLAKWNELKKSNEALGNFDVLQCPEMIEGYNFIQEQILNRGKKSIEGEHVWKLKDTYGVNVDAAERMARILGLKFDKASCEKYLEMIKRMHRDEYTSKMNEEFNRFSFVVPELKKNISPTSDHFKYEYRRDDSGNYVFKSQPTTIEAIILDKRLVEKITPFDAGDNEIGLVLDRTPFYCESGGQESDTGVLVIEDEINFRIRDAVKLDGYVIHLGRFEDSTITTPVEINNLGVIQIDGDKRLKAMRNHTATHLLNATLQNLLTVTAQRSSKVSSQRLSFEFSVYKEPFRFKELEMVEKTIRRIIKHDVCIRRKILSRNQIAEIDSLSFLTGRDYSNPELYVIEINSGYFLSKELCCGTHLLRTSDLIDFVVTKFKSSSQASKNIQAVTGEEAVVLRKADSVAEDSWASLKDEALKKIESDPNSLDEVDKKLGRWDFEIQNSDAISYLTKHRLKKNVAVFRKNFKTRRNRNFK